jgi:protein-L-isoaspartate O-methyltransferase
MYKTKSNAEDGAISFHAANGRLGYPVVAPYNAIHVGAAAP